MLVQAAFLVFLILGRPALAEQISFDGSWREQGFLRLWSNKYIQKGDTLKIESNGTVSLIWRPLGIRDRLSSSATWNWSVSQGVERTDLTQKGGDDRNMAIYFIFVDQDAVAELNTASALKLLQNPKGRALVYIWGGANEKGKVLQSRYHPNLRYIILRSDDIGSFNEKIDLKDDYRRAFGTDIAALVGLVISADSDDTKGKIRASISTISLK